MRKITSSILVLTILGMSLVFGKDFNPSPNVQTAINVNNISINLNDTNRDIQRTVREEIILYEQDFEGDVSEWNNDSGWELTELESYSPTHSFLSPNESNGSNEGVWTLISPVLELPDLGADEIMHFKFALNCNMPDSDGDGDNFLEDYYWVSIADVDALAWHTSDFNAYSGNSYWCGDEEVEGYLDGWLQFLDTPEIVIPETGYTLSTQMRWGIESPADAGGVAGHWIDGWDAANVRISTDAGQTWEILIGSDSYDFYSGYGWIYNGEPDGVNGTHTLASGWGGQADWHNVSFDLSSYAGQTVMIRFAFGSDPAYSTVDDASLTGFIVDDIVISNGSDIVFEADADSNDPMNPTGLVWVQQFYDYGADDRPGGLGWEEYLPGYPFCDGCNTYLDISNFAGRNVIFRFSSRYDEDDDGGNGDGLFIDDLTIYKESSANYPPPAEFGGEAFDGEVNLWWNDMNASGTNDFIYDNDDVTDQINLTDAGEAYAGEIFEFVGASTVNSISVFSVNEMTVDTRISAFGTVGAFFDTDPTYDLYITLEPGWNTFELVNDWSFSGSYIIAMEFTNFIYAGLDASATPSTNSVVMLGSGWDLWADVAAGSGGGLNDGEWGIRANITYSGAGVTYNIYESGVNLIVDGLTNNSYIVEDLENNITYSFAISATYPDGSESELSEAVELTPQSNSVYELSYDDGTSEFGFNAGQNNYTAVRFTTIGNDPLVRVKWYQVGDGGAFYLKIYSNDGDTPGNEIFSTIVTGGVDGWNTRDLIDENLTLSGTFWVGAKEFSSTHPFGLDTGTDTGNSYFRVGDGGTWEPIANSGLSGNLMFRVSLDHPVSGEISIDVPHLSDWNLVGAPVGTQDIPGNYLGYYPDAIEGTLYSFTTGYEQVEDMYPGVGYWLRFTENGSNVVTGTQLNVVEINLQSDWNLISGTSENSSVDNIIDPDALIIPGTIYGFGVGYEVAESLEPGEGYWVRSNGEGQITIATAWRSKTHSFVSKLENANHLTINNTTLYFGVQLDEKTKLSYSLPPKPPAGSFDIRFAGDWKVTESYGMIDVMNPDEMLMVNYYVNIDEKWELTDERGNVFELIDDGVVEIAGDVTKMELRKSTSANLPTEFALKQNYPNPFNPTTVIRYQVPVTSDVQLTVYDLMGRKVKKLVSGSVVSGTHHVTWNGIDTHGQTVASGMYLYRLISGEYTETKKLLLLR